MDLPWQRLTSPVHFCTLEGRMYIIMYVLRLFQGSPYLNINLCSHSQVFGRYLTTRLTVANTVLSAPPTNTTAFNQWTVGAIYYSVLIVAEAFGTSNTSQIVDTSNNGIFTPSYAIYEKGALARVALFNYNDDPSGASDITATITIGGGNVPAQVQVK